MVMFNVVSENFVLRLKRKMFEAILRQDMSWFDKPENGVGSLCARISSETAKVQIVRDISMKNGPDDYFIVTGRW